MLSRCSQRKEIVKFDQLNMKICRKNVSSVRVWYSEISLVKIIFFVENVDFSRVKGKKWMKVRVILRSGRNEWKWE